MGMILILRSFVHLGLRRVWQSASRASKIYQKTLVDSHPCDRTLAHCFLLASVIAGLAKYKRRVRE